MIIVPIAVKDLIHDVEGLVIEAPLLVHDAALLMKEGDDMALTGELTGKVIAKKYEKIIFVGIEDLRFAHKGNCNRCGKEMDVVISGESIPAREFYASLPKQYKDEEVPDVFPLTLSNYTADVGEMLWQELTLLTSRDVYCEGDECVMFEDEEKVKGPFEGLKGMM